MAKSLIRHLKIDKPLTMEYYVNIENARDKDKFIKRIEKIVRSSMEYRDYIQFIKENLDLDACIFFNHVTTKKATNHHKISIEQHHEPFTLYDIVAVVLEKFLDSGEEINDLLIADEVLELHYANMVGLVPLSKTAHQIIHNSDLLIVPLNMVYGNYSKFLEDYEPYISDDLYDKLERKLDMAAKLTPESFEALVAEFKYYDVEGQEDIEKLELSKDAVQVA